MFWDYIYPRELWTVKTCVEANILFLGKRQGLPGLGNTSTMATEISFQILLPWPAGGVSNNKQASIGPNRVDQ